MVFICDCRQPRAVRRDYGLFRVGDDFAQRNRRREPVFIFLQAIWLHARRFGRDVRRQQIRLSLVSGQARRLRDFNRHGGAFAGGFRVSVNQRRETLDTFQRYVIAAVRICEDRFADFLRVVSDRKTRCGRRIKRDGFAVRAGARIFRQFDNVPAPDLGTTMVLMRRIFRRPFYFLPPGPPKNGNGIIFLA